MKLFSDQRGFSHVLLVGFIIVLGVIGFAGYRVMSTDSSKDESSNSAPAKIESKKDVEQAKESLDSDNLDNDLNPNQLDSDLNDVL